MGPVFSGRDSISTDDAKDFVGHAVREGKTQNTGRKPPSNVFPPTLMGAVRTTGCRQRVGSKRAIQPVRIQESTVFYLAHKLHFDGLGDNAVINHKAWALFGLDASDVREEPGGWRRTDGSLSSLPVVLLGLAGSSNPWKR